MTLEIAIMKFEILFFILKSSYEDIPLSTKAFTNSVMLSDICLVEAFNVGKWRLAIGQASFSNDQIETDLQFHIKYCRQQITSIIRKMINEECLL